MKSQHQPQDGSWIEIAREGTFRDSGGSSRHFTRERLAGIAASYDPGKREAPLVFGHPAVNGPAFGWVRGLKMEGPKLLANLACVTDEVKAAVDNGLYRYVSMSLYPDDGLRHVGLLGGTPPAIDGLAPVSFGGEAALTIDFNNGEEPDQDEPQTKGSQMTIDELTRQIAELQSRVNALTQEREAALKEAAELKGALEQSKTETEKTVTEFAAFRDQKAKEAVNGRIEKMVATGRLTPAERLAVEKVAEALRQDPRNFSSGQGENALETYLVSLETRPASPLMADFSAPAGDRTENRTEDQPAHKPLSAKL